MHGCPVCDGEDPAHVLVVHGAAKGEPCRLQLSHDSRVHFWSTPAWRDFLRGGPVVGVERDGQGAAGHDGPLQPAAADEDKVDVA